MRDRGWRCEGIVAGCSPRGGYVDANYYGGPAIISPVGIIEPVKLTSCHSSELADLKEQTMQMQTEMRAWQNCRRLLLSGSSGKEILAAQKEFMVPSTHLAAVKQPEASAILAR